jgi:hypothetical protein
MQTTICLLLLCLIKSDGFAQDTFQMYKVVSLPRKTGYTKETLNSAIASLKGKNEVLKVIRTRIQTPQNVTVVIRVKKVTNNDTTYAWWTLNLNNNREREGDWVVLQSRSNETTRIYSLDDLADSFSDTLLVIDTLRFESYVQDAAFNPDRYYVLYSCDAVKAVQKVAVPSTNHTVYFTKNLIKGCSNVADIKLYNEAEPDKALASSCLVFADDDIKSTLLQVAQSLREEHPRFDTHNIARYLAGFVKSNYGEVSYQRLENWLQNHTTQP